MNGIPLITEIHWNFLDELLNTVIEECEKLRSTAAQRSERIKQLEHQIELKDDEMMSKDLALHRLDITTRLDQSRLSRSGAEERVNESSERRKVSLPADDAKVKAKKRAKSFGKISLSTGQTNLKGNVFKMRLPYY